MRGLGGVGDTVGAGAKIPHWKRPNSSGMKDVDLYAKVRHAVRIEGMSKRAAARRFGIDPRTVDKMLEFSVPPGYRRSRPPVKPKLGPFIAIIDAILAEDQGRPKKQQHTSDNAERSGALVAGLRWLPRFPAAKSFVEAMRLTPLDKSGSTDPVA
jgi:hypothetical protein